MTKNLSALTCRVIGVALLGLLFASCLGTGSDQLHGMFSLSFPSTAVCNAQENYIQFRNDSDQEMVIEGAAISVGTDPEGNFTLVSMTVGSEVIEASAGILNDIHIPPHTSYRFTVTYTPHVENASHTAVLDIAYSAPEAGVVQVTLSGSSVGRAPTCPSSDASTGEGAGDLNGDLSITISRIAFVSSALTQPISTDPANTVVPFEPVTVPIQFNAAGNSATLPLIPSGVFLLPPTKTAPLSTLITGFTEVTTTADVTGSYPDDGSVVLEDVPVHLKECFQADFTVTLTTEPLNIPTSLSVTSLRRGGFTVSDDQKQILGSSINADSFELVLIGVSTFDNPSGSCDVTRSIGGTTGAVVINAKVNP